MCGNEGIGGMAPVTFELCAETLAACDVARAGGADRIELCSALDQDGLTPSHALIGYAIEQSGLPVHVLLRPRAGDFCYSEEEFGVICNDLEHAKAMGATGFVAGFLEKDGSVNKERTRALVSQAAPLPVTFHRAFDHAADLHDALEAVVACGCDRILTSGGAPDVYQGAAALASLVAQAGDRVTIAVGGGLRLLGAADLAAVTGATHFHGSMRRWRSGGGDPGQAGYDVWPQDLCTMVSALAEGAGRAQAAVRGEGQRVLERTGQGAETQVSMQKDAAENRP